MSAHGGAHYELDVRVGGEEVEDRVSHAGIACEVFGLCETEVEKTEEGDSALRRAESRGAHHPRTHRRVPPMRPRVQHDKLLVLDQMTPLADEAVVLGQLTLGVLILGLLGQHEIPCRRLNDVVAPVDA